MVLFLHNRYRTTGGEERVVADLMELVRDELGEPVSLLARDSADATRAGAALGLLRGGLDPREVEAAVRREGARIVHAHNLLPGFGWRALAAARRAGARVVLHLHQYRLVCAVGVCFTGGEECTRCHGRNTLPGVLRNCRGARAEALAYGASLALWQRRLAAQADALVVPSRFAAARLAELGAPLHVAPDVLAPPVASGPAIGPDPNGYALVVSRLAPEKGIDVAIDACRIAGVPLRIAGDGPERARLEDHARGAEVRFEGVVPDERLRQLRAGSSIALVPSLSAETFGLAAAEAMSAGLPVAGSRIGALPELVPADWLVEPGDATALAGAIGRLAGDVAAGRLGRARAEELCSPRAVAAGLRGIYERVAGMAAAQVDPT